MRTLAHGQPERYPRNNPGRFGLTGLPPGTSMPVIVRRSAQTHHGWRATEEPPIPLVIAGRGWLASDRLLGVSPGLRRGHAWGSAGHGGSRCDSSRTPERRRARPPDLSALIGQGRAPRAKRCRSGVRSAGRGSAPTDDRGCRAHRVSIRAGRYVPFVRTPAWG